MSIELINEELGVYSCSIADLTMDQVSSFLKQWNDGSAIETLTVFYDTDGAVVINADNKEFETFEKITVKYMMLPMDQRIELKNSMKVDFGFDIEFRYKGNDYTVLPWTDEGVVIGPQNSDEEIIYESADDLINNYRIDGKCIKDIIQDIEILLMQ